MPLQRQGRLLGKKIQECYSTYYVLISLCESCFPPVYILFLIKSKFCYKTTFYKMSQLFLLIIASSHCLYQNITHLFIFFCGRPLKSDAKKDYSFIRYLQRSIWESMCWIIFCWSYYEASFLAKTTELQNLSRSCLDTTFISEPKQYLQIWQYFFWDAIYKHLFSARFTFCSDMFAAYQAFLYLLLYLCSASTIIKGTMGSCFSRCNSRKYSMATAWTTVYFTMLQMLPFMVVQIYIRFSFSVYSLQSLYLRATMAIFITRWYTVSLRTNALQAAMLSMLSPCTAIQTIVSILYVFICIITGIQSMLLYLLLLYYTESMSVICVSSCLITIFIVFLEACPLFAALRAHSIPKLLYIFCFTRRSIIFLRLYYAASVLFICRYMLQCVISFLQKRKYFFWIAVCIIEILRYSGYILGTSHATSIKEYSPKLQAVLQSVLSSYVSSTPAVTNQAIRCMCRSLQAIANTEFPMECRILYSLFFSKMFGKLYTVAAYRRHSILALYFLLLHMYTWKNSNISCVLVICILWCYFGVVIWYAKMHSITSFRLCFTACAMAYSGSTHTTTVFIFVLFACFARAYFTTLRLEKILLCRWTTVSIFMSGPFQYTPICCTRSFVTSVAFSGVIYICCRAFFCTENISS
uniref:PDP63R n=1 Tax=African swine fever virus TaxID=10497 RepID=A0A649YJL9_ASF